VKRVVTKDNRLCPDWHKSLASLSTVSESNPKPPTLPTVTKQQAQNFFIPDTGSSSQPLPALAPKTLPQTPQPPLKILQLKKNETQKVLKVRSSPKAGAIPERPPLQVKVMKPAHSEQ
jgi:hypothetical protein